MAEFDSLGKDFARLDPSMFAKVLGRGERSEIVRVLEQLPASHGASIVAKLPSSCTDVIAALDRNTVARWLADAPVGDAVSLLGRIPRDRSLTIIDSLDNRKRRRKLLQLLKYPAHSVGALLSDVFVRLTADRSAADALSELRTVGAEDPGPIVVLESDGRYLGVLDLWPLIVSEPLTGRVRDYVSQVPAIFPETSVASAALDTNWYSYNWLPVVDHDGRLLGGVWRHRVFGSTSMAPARASRENEIITNLASDMVRVLGALLDRIIGGRTAP